MALALIAKGNTGGAHAVAIVDGHLEHGRAGTVPHLGHGLIGGGLDGSVNVSLGGGIALGDEQGDGILGLTALLGGAAPVVERLVSWLCLSLVLLAVFAASVKAALPDLPLKEILRPRNVAFIAILALMLGLADMVLPTVWQGYDARTQLVWRVGATCLLAFVCCAALSRHGKKPAAAAEPPRSQRTEVEKAAMALADSVCPKYKP